MATLVISVEVMSIHEAKNMGEVIELALRVSSRSEGRRFVMEYLEAAPELTEEKIQNNLWYGLSRHFDSDHDEIARYMSYFTE